MYKADYATMDRALTNALNDLEILAGNDIGPSDSSWQDIAGTAACNLQVLVNQLEAARKGKGNCITFPSPKEILED